MNDQFNVALRYIGTSLGTLFTIFGAMQFVTSDQVAQLTVAIHDFNESVLSAYGALTKMWIILGPAGVVILARLGVKSSSVQAIGQKLLSIATSPASPTAAEAQKVIVQATGVIAKDKTIPASDDAKNALIAATIALPEVQTIVT